MKKQNKGKKFSLGKKYENGTKYNFLTRVVGSALGETLQRLNDILYGVVEAKPYTFDWDVIIPEYERNCGKGGDLDQFCLDHVLADSLLNGYSTDSVLREAKYLHLRAEILAKKAKGEI